MSNPERFPGTREEDAWLSDEQLERCGPAESPGYPVPVMPASLMPDDRFAKLKRSAEDMRLARSKMRFGWMRTYV